MGTFRALVVFLSVLLSCAVCDAQQDLERVLHLSQKFYVAQRCGDLPDDNRVTWRRDSFLEDGQANGLDLEGGYFDAGDHIKFGFPFAYTMMMMAWGMVQYKSAFESSGELNFGLENLKWGTDYILKAHPNNNELWVQGGDPYVDHDFWGRPEEFPFNPRPFQKIDANNPGTDVAALTAAALAASAMVFRDQMNSNYADELIAHAEALYEFADTRRGIYSDAIQDAEEFYASSGYEDELVLAAIWIYKATGDDFYLTEAVNYYDEFGLDNDWSSFLDWDEKRPAVNLLMYEATSDSKYRNKITEMGTYYLNEAPRTPGGMLYFGEWASAANAAAAAFTLLVADDLGIGPGGEYASLAAQQIDYILGNNPLGVSYVIGYGANYPLRPHHSSSSCPTVEECGGCECGWEAYDSPEPNPQVLEGALVGGPGANDDWDDDRTDYIKNEVALDYNAGIQAAVAGLIAKGIKI